MATFRIEIPITGRLSLEVEADSEEEAKEKAMDKACLDDLEDWEMETLRDVCATKLAD